MQETLIVTGTSFNDDASGATLIVRCSPPPVTMAGAASPIAQPVSHAFTIKNATEADRTTYVKGATVTATLALVPATPAATPAAT